MEIKLTKLPKSRVKIQLHVPAKAIKPVVDKVYGELAESVEITGFRKGKAPRAMVLDRVGIGRLEQEVSNHALNHAYAKAIQEHQLVPVGQPAVAINSFTISADGAHASELKATVEVDVLPTAKIDGYKAIKVKKNAPPATASDTDVDKLIEHLRQQKANLTAKKEAIKKGDWANVSFKGYLNGVLNEKLQSQNYPLIVGSNVLVPGFEDELVGLQASDTKRFNITFPKDYFAKELAGQRVAFDITVHEVRAVELPPADETFAKNFGHDNIASLRQAIAASITNERRRQSQLQLQTEVLAAALKKLQTEMPESLVEAEIARMMGMMREDVGRQGLPFEIYLEKINKTAAQLRLDLRDQAMHNVKVGLLLGEVARQEKIDPQAKDAAQQAINRLVEYATK